MSNKKKLKKLYIATKEFERARGKTIEYILVEIIYNRYADRPDISLNAIQLYHNWLVDSADIDVDWFDVGGQSAEIIPFNDQNKN